PSRGTSTLCLLVPLPLCSLTKSGTPTTSTLSLHDALPICKGLLSHWGLATWLLLMPSLLRNTVQSTASLLVCLPAGPLAYQFLPDRKSTRLNSSHVSISYAVFCLQKKKRRRLTRRQVPVRQ